MAVSWSYRNAMPCPLSHPSSFGTSSTAAGTPGFEMMPTVLMTGIEQELLIAFRAGDGTFHDGRFETQALHRAFHALTRGAMQFRRPHDAAFADLAFPHLELWLVGYNHATLGAQNRRGRRQNQGYGNEADVKRCQIHEFADVLESQISRVHAFVYHDARIVAQLPIELARAHVHRMHARRPALQQAICEATGGTANVQAHAPGHLDVEFVQRRRQLDAAAAHIRRFAGDCNAARGVDIVARLKRLLPVHQNIARHDERLRLFAGFSQAALDQQTIEPLFHDLRCTMRSASSRSRPPRSPNMSSAW